jgi:hypothetical protein
MRIAELASKRSVTVASLVTAGLVAWKWPQHERRYTATAHIDVVGQCGEHHHHRHMLLPPRKATIVTAVGALQCTLATEQAPSAVGSFAMLAGHGHAIADTPGVAIDHVTIE